MPLENEKDVQLLKNRYMDLATKAYRQNIFTFTSFLGITEQSVFYEMERDVNFVPYAIDGGNEQCERKIIRFGSPQLLGYEEEYPITCIRIRPLLKKFSDELGHRDYLGAILNLGIDRSTIGDIVPKENEGFMFCTKSIAPFIMENLDKIKHTHVACEEYQGELQYIRQEGENMSLTVAATRIDAILSGVYNMSRGKSLELFQSGIVYLNGRLCENNSQPLKPGDVVNVRGKGKFYDEGISYTTKNGKQSLNLTIYR